jgi:radical SAM protein with 4Fe4S-binding SPASM domain
MLDLLQREQIHVVASFDFTPGVRLGRRGELTEGRVADNLDRLQKRRIPVTATVVLGAHNRDRMPAIHDFFAQRGIGFSIVPLFAAPAAPGTHALTISHSEAAAALEDLFLHWIAADCPVPVHNLASYLSTDLLRLASLHRLAWNPQQNGGRVFVVDTDGTLWSLVERYRPLQALGNLFLQPLDKIIESPAYQASVHRRIAMLDHHCGECRYRGSCDGEPVSLYHDEFPAGPCPIASRVCAFIEDRLRRWGFDEATVVDRLSDSLLAVPLSRAATSTLAPMAAVSPL